MRTLALQLRACLCAGSLVMLCITTATASAADAPVQPEYALKAALIYKLAKFVAWPADPGAEAAAPSFNLCVLGEESLARALTTLTGRTIGERPIAIHAESVDADLARCDLVYFNSVPPASRLDASAALPILTVSDAEGFALRGGMVEITRRRNRLGFRINARAAREAGLTVAAPLLDLATVIDR